MFCLNICHLSPRHTFSKNATKILSQFALRTDQNNTTILTVLQRKKGTINNNASISKTAQSLLSVHSSSSPITMSVSKKIAPTTVILGLMGTWAAFWSLERMVLYSYSTPDTMVNSTLHNYMPWSDTPEEWKQAFGGAMSQMYAIDREFFSRVIHVQLSGVIALCCLINLYLGDDVAALSDAELLTSTKAWIHRFTGRVFQTCVIPWSLYLNYVLFVHGMINFVSNIIIRAVLCANRFALIKLIRFLLKSVLFFYT